MPELDPSRLRELTWAEWIEVDGRVVDRTEAIGYLIERLQAREDGRRRGMTNEDRARIEQSNEVAGIVFDEIKRVWPDLHPVFDLRYGIADALWDAGFRRSVVGKTDDHDDHARCGECAEWPTYTATEPDENALTFLAYSVHGGAGRPDAINHLGRPAARAVLAWMERAGFRRSVVHAKTKGKTSD